MPGTTKGKQFPIEESKMTFPVNESYMLKYVYKYDVDAVTGAVSLRPDPNAIKEGLVVMGVQVRFKQAFVGATALTLGNTSDPDGYMADFFSFNALDAVANSGAVAGALIWDDVNDHAIHYRIGSTANLQDLVLTITGTATAGELEIYLMCTNDL